MKQVDSVGNYGAKVAILRKENGGPFYLRWRDRETGKLRSQVTDCRVLSKAKKEALSKAEELSKQLPENTSRLPRPKQQVVTWGRLLSWYEETWMPLAASESERENNPRVLALWRHFLPLESPVEDLEPAVLESFVQKRKAGNFTVGEYQFRAKVSDRTVGKDLEWLRRVVNKGIQSPNLKLRYNPLGTIDIPNTPVPKRPVATEQRWKLVRQHADDTGSQGLFGGFWDVLRALGWRVDAICQIKLSDIDTKHWRIRRDGEVDKEGHDVWVSVSDSLKPRLEALLKARKRLKIESPWLFPKVEDPTQPWPYSYARGRLRTAEKAAGLQPLEGGEFHPYRRLWARQLKDEPTVNVAAAGAWKSTRMVELYQGLVTEDEVAQVMNAIKF